MNLSGSKIAVTGATGFIGRYIVRALLERGAHVIAVVRNPDKVPAFKDRGVELRKADLRDTNALYAGFAGADAVISNAAMVSLGKSNRDELIAANVQGVRNVFEAIACAGITRVVHTSSASAYRPKPDHFYSEDDPLRSESDKSNRFSHYPLSKACGEREAWRLAETHQLQLTVLRPYGVYGAFDEHSFTKVLRVLLSLPISPFPTHTRIPNLYAGDLAEAFCLALETPASVGRAYNLASAPAERTLWDHYRGWKEAGGKTPWALIPIPVPLAYRYSIDRAVNELHWSNRSLTDGFADMFQMERDWK